MRLRVGLALGAGGARGLAHLGVLQVLEEAGIPVDFLAGSSMGAVIAVAYANRLPLDRLERLATSVERRLFLDFTPPRWGFLKGERVGEFVRLLTHGKPLEALAIPTAVVATDLERGEPVVFREGPADIAVRASSAIPGIFEPVFYQGRILVDGGVVERVPLAVLREMGADVVIGVDVAVKPGKPRISGLYDVIYQSLEIMEDHIFRTKAHLADVLITPQVGHFPALRLEHVADIIEEGRRAARRKLPEIQAILARFRETSSFGGA
ncbi:patatin-like phospholipase family protein [Brockia lithotrophica]|uniref:NTE family protein n=1 Tax=Brockia lithotrophica TaxID=933949 RepID=A0A660KT20_9BACL|nr:patatin-like phospholipase family protein [Brockia lithotrophica]RKQ83641.1 NTE family protein [Brockia lithotrophica]